MKNTTCAVIVSYNPDSRVEDTVRLLFLQVDEIIIVDNSSDFPSRKILEQLEDSYNLKIFWNSKNLGIAAALNIGVRYAVTKGYDWLATFDQDSIPDANLISLMLQSYYSCDYADSVSIIAPTYIFSTDESFGNVDAAAELHFSNGSAFARDLPLFTNSKVVITSGNLVRLEIFEKVGMFDESFFIDYVDFEFCLRCATYGYQIITCNNARLSHRLGDSSFHTLFGKKCMVTNHSPLRLFYRSKNRFLVYRKYFKANPIWVVLNLRSFIYELVLMLVFEKNRIRKFCSAFSGVLHGVIPR
jgi:rhamnosyltransferase